MADPVVFVMKNVVIDFDSRFHMKLVGKVLKFQHSNGKKYDFTRNKQEQQCLANQALGHRQCNRLVGFVYFMKYPDTRQCPSLSNMGVMVSTADFLFLNEALNWITTYSPSGAPGKAVR